MNLLHTRIDLAAITHNTQVVKAKLSPATRLMGVVKADGYNHGAVEVARAMIAGGADAFGVATLEEALQLKAAGIEQPVLAWIWRPGETVTDALAAGVELGVPSISHLDALIDANIPASICLKVETGMHRSGIEEADWAEAFVKARDAGHLTVTGVFSHLACADEPDHPANNQQHEAFKRAIALGRELGLELPINHLANSAGTLTRPDFHHEQVRVGIALYGLEPGAGDHGLKPAMTWCADVMTIKPVDEGDCVSYGWAYTVKKPGYTAVIPAGYADGVPRSLSGKLVVHINGHMYPQIGRVCMDQLVVDLGENPFNVSAGDEAVLFGPGGSAAEDVAKQLGTINYEVLCLPCGRTTRIYTHATGEGQ